MGGITGWDSGIGTLLGLWLKSQSQKKEEETLRQLLEDQQRRQANTAIGAGTMQGPVEPPGARAPMQAPQRSFGEALLGVPSDILSGATGGPPGLPAMKEAYARGEEDIKRQQSLADQLRLYQQQQALKPKSVDERMLEAYMGTQGPQAAMDLWSKHYTRPAVASVTEQALQNIPQGMQRYGEKLVAPPEGPQPPPPQYNPVTVMGPNGPEVRSFNARTGQMEGAGVPAPVPGMNKAPTVGQINELQGYQNILDNLDYIEKLRKPEYTGMEGATGSLRQYKAGGKFGMEQQEQDFRSAVDSLKDAAARLKEGAVIPPEMMKRLEKFLPGLTNIDEKFTANANNMRRETEQARQNLLELMQQSGIRIPGQLAPPPARQPVVQPGQTPPSSTSPQGGGGQPTGAGRAVRVEEGPLKGMVIDNKASYDELKRSGVITGKEKVSIEGQ